MKKIIFILSIFTFVNLTAQEAKINWVTVNEALELQKKNPKPIFMDVYTTWCGPCKMLDAQVFNQPQFIELINKNYYAVKFNGEGNEAVNFKGVKYSNPGYDPSRSGRNAMHEFTGFLQVKGYPSLYVLNEKGDQQNVIVGFRTADQLIAELSAK
jgi:thioredoxin-related protein